MKETKLDQSKSRFANSAYTSLKDDFEKKVKDVSDSNNERNKKAFELGSAFIKLLDDKTLKENKGPQQTNKELQICNELFNLATELNNADNEPEAAGAAMLDVLFFRALISMRNRLNEIEFQLSKQNKNG